MFQLSCARARVARRRPRRPRHDLPDAAQAHRRPPRRAADPLGVARARGRDLAPGRSGTFPVQSERLYEALKGLGATVRLVLLPYEQHGSRARESVLHHVWEEPAWLDRYVKPAARHP